MSKGTHETDSRGVTLSKRTLIVLVIVSLLLIAGGIIIGLNWNNWFGDTPDTPAGTEAFNPDIDPNAGDWTGGDLPDKGDGQSTGIQIPGYPSITLPADTQTVSVALLNPEGNPCYFTFELVLRDTDEVLYSSKLVPPGQVISQITLSRALPAGEYDAIIRITTSSLEDGSAMNGADVVTTLIAE